VDFVPRSAFLPFHVRERRWTCIVAHRRAGKTLACIADLLTCALATSKPNARYAYIAPYHAQAKAVAWDYLKRLAREVVVKQPSESELQIELPNGSRVRLYGADNPDSLRGLYLDGVVLDEYGDMRPNVWGEIIRPLLTDRKGWAVFIGTPKGKNHFHAIHDTASRSGEWLSLSLRASETGLIDASELADARKQMTPEQYAQEFECAFDVPALGAIYAAELAQAKVERRIGRVVFDGSALVNTAWDLGIGDATAIWFYQVVQGEVHLIDYYEASGKPITHFLSVLAQRPYVYGKHFVPHDAAGRELGTGKSIAEMMRAQGTEPTVMKRESAEVGINAARVLFARCWFDASACAEGLDALMNYRREFNDKLGEFKNTPVHDWASHGADAFRYLALSVESAKQGKPKPLIFASEF
jgi:phage terminase large subunit